jgi:hypothetical protein
MKDLLKFKDFQASQYKVVIDIAANGFIVRAGCKKFVCEDLDELMTELFAFFKGEFTDLSKQLKDQLCLNPPGAGLVARPMTQDEVCVDQGEDC